MLEQPVVLARQYGRRVSGRDVARHGPVPSRVHRARRGRCSVRAAGVLLRATRSRARRTVDASLVDGDAPVVPRAGRRAVRARDPAAQRPYARHARGRGQGMPWDRRPGVPLLRWPRLGRAHLRQLDAPELVPQTEHAVRPLAPVVLRAALSAARNGGRSVRRAHGRVPAPPAVRQIRRLRAGKLRRCQLRLRAAQMGPTAGQLRPERRGQLLRSVEEEVPRSAVRHIPFGKRATYASRTWAPREGAFTPPNSSRKKKNPN